MGDFRGPINGVMELPALTRFEVNLQTRELTSVSKKLSACDYPAFNLRLTGRQTRYCYATRFLNPLDPLAGSGVVKYDHQREEFVGLGPRPGEVFGESVFVPHPDGRDEDDGWLLFLGYRAAKDQTFVEIRNGKDFTLAA